MKQELPEAHHSQLLEPHLLRYYEIILKSYTRIELLRMNSMPMHLTVHVCGSIAMHFLPSIHSCSHHQFDIQKEYHLVSYLPLRCQLSDLHSIVAQ